jgi:succinoglycan biosynthesis protein ExoA
LERRGLTLADALVVIPCLNEESYIESVIRNVARDRAADEFLIVVADGGSSDGTRDIVSRLGGEIPNLRLVSNSRKIQSAGVNMAARMFGAERRWLVRVDAHAEYPEDFISQLIAEAERTGASSVVVAMRAQGRSCFQRAAAAAQNSMLGAGGSPHRRDGAEGFVDHGHHALFDLQRFLALGGYDETQSHNEDAEFDVRLARSGGRIWLTRRMRIGYFPRATVGALYRQYLNYGRGRATTILRHRVRPKVRQMIPATVMPSALVAFVEPWFQVAAFPVATWLAACLIFGTMLGLRERSRCAFASGCVAPVMHIAWSMGFWSGLVNAAASAARPRRRALAAGAP